MYVFQLKMRGRQNWVVRSEVRFFRDWQKSCFGSCFVVLHERLRFPIFWEVVIDFSMCCKTAGKVHSTKLGGRLTGSNDLLPENACWIAMPFCDPCGCFTITREQKLGESTSLRSREHYFCKVNFRANTIFVVSAFAQIQLITLKHTSNDHFLSFITKNMLKPTNNTLKQTLNRNSIWQTSLKPTNNTLKPRLERVAKSVKANEQHVKAKAWTTYYGKSAHPNTHV